MAAKGKDFSDQIHEENKAYLELIERALKEELSRYRSSRLYGPLLYALEAGKRVRPLILLVTCEAAGKGNLQEALPAAVAVELLHTESIIHDDIIDQEVIRRDRPAFYIRHGYGPAVLTADFVFGIILDIASRYRNPRVARELASAALRMCEGEFSELKIDPGEYKLPWDEYVKLIGLKTASLFQTASTVGALLGGATEELAAGLGRFGFLLGIAYQIQDDIIDWGEGGKITRAVVTNPRASDTLVYLTSRAEEYASASKRELNCFPESPFRDRLVRLADFTIRRAL